jgi:hypothetical protein
MRHGEILVALVAVLAIGGCAEGGATSTKHNPINEFLYGGGPRGQKPVEESERRERQAENEKSDAEWRAEVDKCTYRKLGYVPGAGHTPQEESCEASIRHGGPKTGATEPMCGTERPYSICLHPGEHLAEP